MTKSSGNRLEYMAILLMIFASGSVCLFRLHAALTVVLYICFAMYFYLKRHGKMYSKSKIYIFIYSTYLIINFALNNSFSEISYLITYVSFAVGSLLIISSINKTVFFQKYLTCITYLAFISMVVYLLHSIGVIHEHVVTTPAGSFLLVLGHCVGFIEPFERLAGVFWEPGAYQIVLNIALLIMIQDSVTLSDFKSRYLNKTIIILIALILTKSTTGYIVTFVLVIMACLKFGLLKKKFSLFSLFIVAGIIGGTTIIVFNSEAVQSKIFQSQVEGVSSFSIRYNDNVGLIQMIKERPIMGWGIFSAQFQRRALQLDNLTSSNGDLFVMACFGIPLFLIIMLQCYKMSGNVNTSKLFILLYFILLNIGECFLYYPLIYIFLLEFRKERYVYDTEHCIDER